MTPEQKHAEYHVSPQLSEFTIGRVVWWRPHLRIEPFHVAPGHVTGFVINPVGEVIVCVQFAYDPKYSYHVHPGNLQFALVEL